MKTLKYFLLFCLIFCMCTGCGGKKKETAGTAPDTKLAETSSSEQPEEAATETQVQEPSTDEQPEETAAETQVQESDAGKEPETGDERTESHLAETELVEEYETGSFED